MYTFKSPFFSIDFHAWDNWFWVFLSTNAQVMIALQTRHLPPSNHFIFIKKNHFLKKTFSKQLKINKNIQRDRNINKFAWHTHRYQHTFLSNDLYFTWSIYKTESCYWIPFKYSIDLIANSFRMRLGEAHEHTTNALDLVRRCFRYVSKSELCIIDRAQNTNSKLLSIRLLFSKRESVFI